MTDKHALERTSPKGTPFIGYCTKCGKPDLTFDAINEDCANPSGMTDGDALLLAVGVKDQTHD
jgi:hypothetical protein